MNIEEIEEKLNSISDTISKMKELASDAKVCQSDITKSLILSAIKKYAASVSDFKLD